MIYCQFIIPWCNNAGTPKSMVHRMYATELLQKFSGCTTHDAKGSWFDNEVGKVIEEMVTVYNVAVDQPADILRLKSFAMKFGRAMHQKEVFFAVLGKAENIDVRKEPENAGFEDNQSNQQEPGGVFGPGIPDVPTGGQASPESGNGKTPAAE